MTRRHIVRRGFDIPLAGAAATTLPAVEPTERVAASVDQLPGLRLKAAVRVGDTVRCGQPVLIARDDSCLHLLAPGTGRVLGIRFGPRRAPLAVELERTAGADSPGAPVARPDPDRIGLLEPDQLVALFKGSGLWPLLRERPLGHVPTGRRAPDAVFINGMDSEPLAADPPTLVASRARHMQLGTRLLCRLCRGAVYLTVSSDAKLCPAFRDLAGVEIHEFSGPHPCGLVGTHIDRIAPIRPGQRYWAVRAQDVAQIGAWIETGHYPTERMVAVAGPSAAATGYRHVREGTPIAAIVGATPPDSRVVQGTVLSGSADDDNAYLNLGCSTLTVIGDGSGRRRVLGWLFPRFDQPSASRASFGWLSPKLEFRADARIHGEPRAIVNFGQWDRVMPLPISIAYLLRAIRAGDVEEAIELGLLDLTEEDVALCTYVDPCKTDVGEIVRRGLEMAAEQGMVP